MDTYFFDIWSYFGPRSRFLKPRLKICTFVDFLEIQFWNWIYVPIWEISMETYFLRYLEQFRPSFKVGQTKVENMHFCWLCQNCVLKVDLVTHLRDKHRQLFLWDLELFWSSFKVGQSKVENMHFLSTFSELRFESGFRYPFKR